MPEAPGYKASIRRSQPTLTLSSPDTINAALFVLKAAAAVAN